MHGLTYEYTHEVSKIEVQIGDSRQLIHGLKDKSIDCVVTSPPYWRLRDYKTEPIIFDGLLDCEHKWKIEKSANPNDRGGTEQQTKGFQSKMNDTTSMHESAFCSLCGAWRGQLGLEPTPKLFIKHLLDFFDGVKLKLKDRGNVFVNLGDTYAGSNGAGYKQTVAKENQSLSGAEGNRSLRKESNRQDGLPAKCLSMIPQRFAWGMIERGWILRNEIIWCLSGGTYVYAKTQKGVMPVMIRDLARLKPETVQLWNGTKWTTVLGISRMHRTGTEIELVLRSGERISCTPTHKFPTTRGLIEGKDMRVGDILEKVRLPDTDNPLDCVIDEDAAWFAGLYIAEGSMSGNGAIQITGHAKEEERWIRLQKIATKFGGSAGRTITGNNMHIRLHGKILVAILKEFVSGKNAHDKCFAPVVWNYSNTFISEMLNGYLSGDGHWDEKNNRWRLGFTRNYNLERDIRVVCTRLDYKVVMNARFVEYNGHQRPTFRGEIRISQSEHLNNSNISEVVEIRKARCREVYDIGVQDEPHVFALASGILTHNSKPNHMPESVTDRLTKAHEVVYHFVKQGKYYYNLDAIREPHIWDDRDKRALDGKRHFSGGKTASNLYATNNVCYNPLGKNPGDVWEYSGKFKGNDEHESFGSPNARTQRLRKINEGNYKFNTNVFNPSDLRARPSDCGNNENGKNPGDVWNITIQPFGSTYVKTSDTIYKVSSDCSIHSPLLHPEILKILSCGEQADCLLSHILDKSGYLYPVLSFSLLSKMSPDSLYDLHSKKDYHHHEIEVGQILGSVHDSKKPNLCSSVCGQEPASQTASHTTNIQKSGAYEVCNSDCSALSDSMTATSHNKEIHKTLSLKVEHGNVFFEIPSHIADILRFPVSSEKDRNIFVNNISGYNHSYERSAQNPFRIVNICSCIHHITRIGNKPIDHFAVFPLELVRRPILAGCPKEVCVKCGKAKRDIKIIGNNPSAFNIRVRDVKEGRIKHTDRIASNKEIEDYDEKSYVSETREIIIAEGCNCNTGFKPGTVLDPFAGSGTVGEFCRHNERNAILFELNPEYKKLIEDRAMLLVPELSEWCSAKEDA